jgi:catechol 2,3-dioxygenase-like lactoylglutathione lyase family enzyme
MALSDFPVRASIAVSDIERAVGFYEGKLRLPLVESGASATIPDGARAYRSGDAVALNVFQSVTAGKSEATLATWYVDDLDATVDELATAGVQFARYDGLEHDERGITERAGGGRVAWFQDPDGNTFAVESDV